MGHYHTESSIAPFPIVIQVRGATLTLLSSPGMFSKDALDTGTALLIESAPIAPHQRILDLACGNGVVGLVLKSLEPSLTVWCTDVTQKAVTLTTENAKRLALDITVARGDSYSGIGDEKFDCILVNPPRAAGKAVIAEMITGALNHLTRNGSLYLVAMTNKGGASYEKMMRNAFGNVEKAARGSGFSVYKSTKA